MALARSLPHFPPPDTPVIDPDGSGQMSNEWYEYFNGQRAALLTILNAIDARLLAAIPPL